MSYFAYKIPTDIKIGDRFITLREIVYSDKHFRFDSKVFPVGSAVTYMGISEQRDFIYVAKFPKFKRWTSKTLF